MKAMNGVRIFFINALGGPKPCHMGHIGLRSPMALAPSLNMPLVSVLQTICEAPKLDV